MVEVRGVSAMKWLLKSSEICETLGVSRSGLRLWLTKGMPVYVIDSHYRFDPEEVRLWLQTKRRGCSLKKKEI